MAPANRARSNLSDTRTAPRGKRYAAGAFAAVSAAGLSGCDPVLNIAGAHFPAWLLGLHCAASFPAPDVSSPTAAGAAGDWRTRQIPSRSPNDSSARGDPPHTLARGERAT